MPATQSGSTSFLSTDFVRQFEQANEQAKSVFAIQKELLDTFAEMNQHWLARARSETEFTTTMANKFALCAVDARYDQRLSRLARPAHATLYGRQQARL